MELIKKILKFGVVGIAGIFIDFGSTFIAKEIIFLNPYVSNSIGFCIAASFNYLLNRKWTFRDKNPQVLSQFFQFFGISIVGLILNNLLILLFQEYLSIPFYVSKFIAIGVVFFWNYFANAKITFKNTNTVKESF